MQAMNLVDVVSFNIFLKQLLDGSVAATNGRSADARTVVAEESDALLAAMRKRGLKANTSTYNMIINLSLALKDQDRAWRFVKLMESTTGIDAYTVSTLLKGQKRDRQTYVDPWAVDSAIRLMCKHNVKVDEILANALLEACSCLRDPAKLDAALAALARNGWDIRKLRTCQTCSLLIKVYGHNRQLHRAWDLWHEVTSEQRGSEQLYGQMIDVLVSAGQLDDAISLFREMQEEYGEHPESPGFSVAYAMIIRGYAQRKDCRKALDCYEEMKHHGVKVGLVIFNTLIDACSRVGDMDGAAQIYRDMLDAECVPDLITYSTLIKGYCICDDFAQAVELFALMRRRGIRPDAIVFNSLLDGAAKQGKLEFCTQVLDDMVEAGLSPSNHSASILIKLHGRRRDLNAAFKIIDELPAKFGFRPNAAVFTCLMATCIQCGRLNEAVKLRERMLREKCQPDEKTYSTLLRGALRGGHAECCLETMHAAIRQGPVRQLLDVGLVKSVFDLLHKKKLWDHCCGQELQDQLESLGVLTQAGGAAYYETGKQRDHGGNHYRSRARH
jgi:pentatricopeptide repeat protein